MTKTSSALEDWSSETLSGFIFSADGPLAIIKADFPAFEFLSLLIARKLRGLSIK
jgi:hypothetical protein